MTLERTQGIASEPELSFKTDGYKKRLELSLTLGRKNDKKTV